jgi:radical SAM protein with 4Fe4S-binding SPASM domain
MRVFILTGEPSGDLHSARLATALLARDPHIELIGVGGTRMRQAGVRLEMVSEQWGAIGIPEALRKVPYLLLQLNRLQRRLRQDPPDVLVPIDFGAFNVRLLKGLQGSEIRTVYYIPPGCWSRRRPAGQLPFLVNAIATPFPWSAENLRAAGLLPVLNTVALRPVLPGLPELARIAGGRGFKRMHVILPHQRGGLEEHLEMAPSGEELLAAFEELLAAAAEAGVVVDNLVAWKRRLRAPQDFCNAGCKDIAVDPSGLVYACAITCGDPAFVAGDAREQSLEEIWRHSPAFRLLRAARARDRAVCAACDVIDACGGECWMQAHYAARAHGRAGGFGAEFPYCGLVRPIFRELARSVEGAGQVAVLSGQLGAGEADLTLFDCI